MTIKVKQTKIIKYLLLINFIFVLSLLELKAQQNKFALSEELIDLNYNVYYSKTDSNGYFWLNNGKQISRYNGNSLKSFSSPDPNGIYVQGEILEDLDGNIWSSVYNHLIKINSKNQSVEKINIKGDTSICEKVLAFNPQKTLLWIKSDDRPIAIDPNTFEKIDTLPFKIDGNSIRLCFNNKNEVNGLISGFSHDKKTWYYYLNENKWQKTPIINHIESKNSKRVICNKGVFYILYNNSIVIASQGHFNTIKSNIPFKASDFIFYNNKLYISTYTKGIIIYDIKNKSWKEFDSNNLLFDKNITSIKRHKNQLVLFFKNKGIQFLNSSTSSINKIYNKEENSDILIKDKQVFIARPDSINIYSYEKYHLNIAESLIENSHKVNQLFNINESQILGVSKKNNFYLFDNQFKIIDSISTNLSVQSIIKNENGILISSTTGIHKINIKEHKINLTKINIDGIKFSAAVSYAIILNNGDLITIPDATKISIKLNNGKIKNIALGLSVSGIYHNKQKDELVISTNSKLFILNNKRELKELLPSEWFYSNQIYYDCLIFDDYILINAQKGLYKYYTHSEKLIKIKDVKATEINSFNSKLIRGFKKEVILIGKSHIYKFNSDQKFDDRKSNLIITEVYVNDKLIKNEKNKLKEPFSKNSFSFRSSVLDFSYPNDAYIKYSLFQKNKEINTKISTSDEVVNFPSLKPGEYKLKIQGTNTSNILTDEQVITITITPPFYLSWWFLLGFSGLLITAGWYTNYLSTQKKLKAQQIEMDRREAVHKTRELIARDLHDDLGTELNKILFLADGVQYQTDENEKISSLDKISTLAGDSIKSMRDMLWVLNTQNESLGKLTTRLRQTMFKNLKEHNIKLLADLPPNHDDVILSNQFMKNIHLICKEATNNCIKYAEANEVQLTIKYENRNLDIVIKDNGKGFEGEIRSDAYGVENMKKRAEEMGGSLNINSTKGQGVLVHLNLDIPEDHIV